MSKSVTHHTHGASEYRRMPDDHLGHHVSGLALEMAKPPEDPADTSYFPIVWGGFSKGYQEMDGEVLAALRERLAGRPLIDLGGNYGLSAEALGRLGVTDYTSVDVQNKHRVNKRGITYVEDDALTYLSRRRSGSANVMANGFLVGNFFHVGKHAPEWTRPDRKVRDTEYVTRLYSHIGRVVPDGGILLGYVLGFTEYGSPNRLVEIKGLTHQTREQGWDNEAARLTVLQKRR